MNAKPAFSATPPSRLERSLSSDLTPNTKSDSISPTRRVAMLRFFSQMLPMLVLPSVLFSQSFTGSISGLVTDSSGAVVPQAAVTVTDLGRNTTFRTESNDSGFYLVGQLSPGSYRV